MVPRRVLQLGDLDAHLDAERGIEVGQRLVEEESLRLAHDRPADGDALALAAGEFARPPVEIGREVEDGGGLRHLLVDFGARAPGHLQSEGDVVAHAHMRVERVGLEDHRQAALRRRRRDDIDAVDEDLAAGRVLEAGDQAEKRRLAATRRADEDDEGAVLDGEIDVRDDFGGAEAFLDALENDLAHALLPKPYLTAPNVMPRTSCF